MNAVRSLLVWLVLALCWQAPARADTPIALARSFDGRMNFTGTQVTLRTKANNKDACAVSSSTTNRTASLSLPFGATVKSAQLYWAGSGALDDTVIFEGRAVTATRRYTSATVGGGFNYFGGAADVTAAVQAKGSGKYNFSGLTISIGNPWCASQAVLGGFSLLVVYSHPSEPERVLNLYEGFSFVQNSELTVVANNFRWPAPLVAVKERARVGHITWEGDPTLAQDGERLRFEGVEMTDAQNPEGNQFNSRSNINGDDSSYGIDFDAFDTTVTIWSGYEPKVTTTYRTGQDLVLLNAEILVLPTMPVSDLSVALTRSGEFKVGLNAAYAVAVANNGPYTEAGPVTVTTTLPNGMAFVSGGGTGWTCAAAGADVSCTYRNALTPGTQAPGLAITAAVKTSGDKTVTVTVKGTDDDKPANNVATNSATAPAGEVSNNPTPGDLPGVAKYVFTTTSCQPGAKVETTAGAACRYYDSTVTAGLPATVFVTAIDGAGNAFAAPASVPMRFALRCQNPATSAGVAARVGAATLPACAPATQQSLASGNWSAEVPVAFASGAASSALAFSYADVGQVELFALGGGAVGTPAGFVVKPWKVDFRKVSRESDGLQAPAAFTPQGAAFARAGEVLLVEIGARAYDAAGNTVWAPNFGNEAVLPVLTLGNAALYTDAASTAHLPNAPPLDIDSASWKAAAGSVSVRASWGETGATRFTVGLDSYLEQGGIGAGLKDVGRFQPAFFTTEITEPFPCTPGIVCAPRDNDVIGMAYSGQPFPVKVVARGMQDQELGNFRGDWFRPITLSMPGPAGAVAAGSFAPGELSTGTTGSLVYTLPATYSADAHRAGGWTAPTTVYLRARANDTRLVAGGTQAAPILSDRSPVASDEDGVVVINGRLRVANALGTEVLRTPLGLRPEYWTGAGGWLGHATYADPVGVNAALAQFPACTRSFVGNGTPCDPALVGVGAPALIRLANGAGVLWLRAPGKQADGKGRDGSISVRFPGWAWLPSTPARVTFGRHRSPVIYLREMY